MCKYWFILLIFVGLIFAGQYLLIEYGVIPNHKQMILTWRVSDEHNIKQFDILRSYNDKNFTKITSLEAKGTGEYTWSDDRFIGKSAHIVYYKIRVIDRNNKVIEESQSFRVDINLSGIKSTWGAIKAMFR
jgi:hypothetical protein